MEKKSLEDLCIHLVEFLEAKQEIEDLEINEKSLLEHFYHAGCDNCSGYNKGCVWYINKTMNIYKK